MGGSSSPTATPGGSKGGQGSQQATVPPNVYNQASGAYSAALANAGQFAQGDQIYSPRGANRVGSYRAPVSDVKYVAKSEASRMPFTRVNAANAGNVNYADPAAVNAAQIGTEQIAQTQVNPQVAVSKADPGLIGRIATMAAQSTGGITREDYAGNIKGSMGKYYNPYTSEVINNAVGDINRNRRIMNNEAASAAGAAGAFGGSRQGLVEAENNRNALEQVGDTSAALRAQMFDTAAGLASNDLSRQQQVLGNNAQASNIAREANTQRRQQAEAVNMDARNARSTFNAANQQQANLTNAAAVNAARDRFSQQRQQVNLANTDARNLFNQLNLNNSQQANMLDAQQRQQANLTNADAANMFEQQDVANRQQANVLTAQQQQAANAQNAQQVQQNRQFNADNINNKFLTEANYRNQVNQLNSNNALRTEEFVSGQQAQAAQLLSNLAQQGFNFGQQITGGQAASGAQNQQFANSLLGQSAQMLQEYINQPTDRLNLRVQSLGANPGINTGTTTQNSVTKTNPGKGAVTGSILSGLGGLKA